MYGEAMRFMKRAGRGMALLRLLRLVGRAWASVTLLSDGCAEWWSGGVVAWRGGGPSQRLVTLVVTGDGYGRRETQAGQSMLRTPPVRRRGWQCPAPASSRQPPDEPLSCFSAYMTVPSTHVHKHSKWLSVVIFGCLMSESVLLPHSPLATDYTLTTTLTTQSLAQAKGARVTSRNHQSYS